MTSHQYTSSLVDLALEVKVLPARRGFMSEVLPTLFTLTLRASPGNGFACWQSGDIQGCLVVRRAIFLVGGEYLSPKWPEGTQTLPCL